MILKTMLIVEGVTQRMDTIEYDGKLWLVPEWTESRDEGWSRPVRIVHPRRQRFGPMNRSRDKVDFFLEYSIPKAVFSGRVPLELRDEYQVLEMPELIFPYLPGLS